MEKVSLRNAYLEVFLIPEIGGKITSLRRRESRFDWMWHARYGSDFRAPSSTCEFSETNLGGIDECLPTIQPMRCDGIDYSDHGQVWRLPASVEELAVDRITTTTHLTEVELRFQRTLVLEENVVHLKYRVSNLGGKSVSFIWAFHPLFRLEAGDRIELQPTPKPIRIDFLKNLPGCRVDEGFSWPKITPDISLENPTSADQDYCAKVFFKSHVHDWATLTHEPTGERLKMEWSRDACPYFGLWVTKGAWNGHTHVAFEPTNYPSDSFLSDNHARPTLAPFATSEWEFTIAVS